MTAEHIAAVRRFNRLVTQRVGALEDDFLGRKRPLGQSRVLFEIGAEGAELRDLRGRLGLDSGYLTRVVQALAAAGLVDIEPAPEDERVRRVRLTPAGLAEVGEMDRRSDVGAAAILEPLSDVQRERLVTAMAEVHRLLLAAGVRIERVHPESRDARWCLERYYAELDRRFESGFDPGASLPAPASELIPPRGAFLVATVDGRAVGCGAVKVIGPGVGSIKRMWISEEMRGLGVGRRILAALEEHAARLGLATLRLETNRSLREAIGLYTACGYREVAPFNDDPYADHWFEKRLENVPA
ncbi:MAG TPA: helix-turn-helix domain-containing GNAT family N-acetyltransferase [Longimicrobiales bacterium]|nr:helix-turn-helix domain-containing GNAT family N-acetyltransferase [Longimicrobiales bacterium]